MGFPNMNYLDPNANGPPLQTQTYYKNYEDNQDNDIKAKREEFSNACEQMPNNTFIKLFHFLNADAGEGGAVNPSIDVLNEDDNLKDVGVYRESSDNREMQGPRGASNNK